MSYFKKILPEEADIRGEGIAAFLDAVKKKGLELHSLMIIRHGCCCAEHWWEPYGADIPHPVYSFSKSLTAAAVGFACNEGILSLDEKITDIFPDECPEVIPENLREVTIHHLLTMSCGHETKPDMESPGWISDFLRHPIPHRPGTWYQYNTAGTNMLAAAVTKKSGQSLLEYLQPRLLEPLGISRISCARLADPMRTCNGGAGMKLTTEEMARFTYFMLHDGEWDGKKILPGWYEKAGAKQIETAGDAEGHVDEWACGYGYQCWMGSLPRSFRADGAYGQFGFVFPTLDLIVVTTSATEETQTLVDCMYDHLLPAVCPDGSLSAAPRTDLSPVFKDLRIPALLSCRNPVIEKEIAAKEWTADPQRKMSGFEKLVGGAGLFDIPDDKRIVSMTFAFGEDELLWTVREENDEKQIRAALDGRFAVSRAAGHEYAACASWRGLYALEMEIRRRDAISGVRLIFRFDGDSMTPEADETLMTTGGLGMNPKELAAFTGKPL